jgi:hypothetical protein
LGASKIGRSLIWLVTIHPPHIIPTHVIADVIGKSIFRELISGARARERAGPRH